uniref:Uncharacterized protein n=1 Tax=Rhizophora mucronata TaxID=61149 RepID=A0A2P2QA13_RHIMU
MKEVYVITRKRVHIECLQKMMWATKKTKGYN